MALERPLPVWTVQVRLAEDAWAATLLVGGNFAWVGARSSDVAAAVHTRYKERLDKGGAAGEPLAALPEFAECRPETIVVDVPRRNGVHDAMRLELPVIVARAAEGAWLAVAPGVGLTWPGPTAEDACEGLKQRVVLEVLAREDMADGRTLLALVQAREARAVREERTFAFPTFGEVRAARKAQGRLLEKATRPLRVGPPGAFELGRELDALARAIGANRSVLLVGPRGGGKTALVRELVRARLPVFGGRPVREADAPGLLLDLLEGGDGWQQPLSRLVTELAEERAWLYVGNLAELFEVGRYEGNETSLAEHLRPAVTRGEARLVAEATPEEVAALEARYPGHLDAWQRLVVPLPGLSLEKVVDAWAAARGPALHARFQPDALREILRLHRRFFPYSGYPGKTLRALEAMAPAAVVSTGVFGEHVEPQEIDREAVLVRFCAESGLPRALVDPLAPLPYAAIRAFFEARIFGQPAAVDAIVATLASVKADVARWGRPLASMLLAGPTGVGKTEMARATAEFLFGGADRMTRFDMSEYATASAVARLVDGPEGEGLLTAAVRRQPFSVVLLDELEKAHPAVLDLLLQALGEGRLTDGRGRTADFSSAVVLMTSNVGAVEARRGSAGFARDAAVDREGRYRAAVSAWLRPELLNRIDRVLAFEALGPDSIDRVLDRELTRFRERPGLRGVPLEVTPEARARLAAAGYHPAWGARQLLRVVHDQLAAPIARGLDGWREGGVPAVRVVAEGDAIAVRLSAGGAARAEDPGDADHRAARALQRRLRDVVEGGVYAERAAHLQALDRARAARPNTWGEDPEPLRTLLSGLQEQVEAARGVERAAGLSAVRGARDPAVVDALARLDATAFKLARGLLVASRPTASICVVGVYGREGVDVLVALYARLAKLHGLEIEAAPLHLRASATAEEADPAPRGKARRADEAERRAAKRAEPRKGGRRAEDAEAEPKPAEKPRTAANAAAYVLVTPRSPPPKDLGPEVGVELRVTGPAAVFLFTGEPGVMAWPSSARAAEMRVRVELFEGDRAAWEGRRPKDLHRRHAFSDTPRRLFGARVEERAERWSGEGIAALEERLGEQFRARVFDAVTE